MFGNGAPTRERKPNTQVIKSYSLKGLDQDKVREYILTKVAEYGMTEREPKAVGMTYDAQKRRGEGVSVYGESRTPCFVTRGFLVSDEVLASLAASA